MHEVSARAMPFLNTFGHFLTPKSSNSHSVWGVESFSNCTKITKIHPFLFMLYTCPAFLKHLLLLERQRTCEFVTNNSSSLYFWHTYFFRLKDLSLRFTTWVYDPQLTWRILFCNFNLQISTSNQPSF